MFYFCFTVAADIFDREQNFCRNSFLFFFAICWSWMTWITQAGSIQRQFSIQEPNCWLTAEQQKCSASGYLAEGTEKIENLTRSQTARFMHPNILHLHDLFQPCPIKKMFLTECGSNVSVSDIEHVLFKFLEKYEKNT